MPRSLSLSRQLLVILSVWIFVGGMASADLFDLTDELSQPLSMTVQLLEPELDELDDQALTDAAGLVLHAYPKFPSPARTPHDSLFAAGSSSDRPLYERLAQYRI